MNRKTVRSISIAAVVIATVAFLTGTLIQELLTERHRTAEMELVQNRSGTIRAYLESILVSDLLMIRAAAAYISVHPDITATEFERFAEQIVGTNETLATLAVAREYTLVYVYPYEENREIIGVSYRDLPDQLPLVEKTIETGGVVIAGPVPTIQGGTGIIGRAPVFTGEAEDRTFWGIVSSLIDFDAAVAQVTPILDRYNLAIGIRGIDGSGARGAAFYGEPVLFDDEMSVRRDITFPNGSWQIAVAPADGWSRRHPDWVLVWFLVIAAAVGGLMGSARMIVTSDRIRSNETRLRDITMASSDIIWETDRQGNYQYVAGTPQRILSVDADDLLGRSLFDRVVADEGEAVSEKFLSAMHRGEGIRDAEVWYLKPGGGRVCLLLNAVPLRDGSSGRVSGYRGVSKDITPRKTLQTAMETNERLLDLFFRQSLDGFFFMMLDEPIRWDDSVDKDALLDWVFDHHRITKVNQAMLDQYGATEAEFVGLTARGFFRHDIDTGKRTWRDLFDTGHLHVDTDERRFDGAPVTIEGDYIVLTDGQNRITGHFGVQRDVTDLRNTEVRLDRYIKIVDEQVITSQTDLDGIITYASEAFARISGYTRDELIGRNHSIVRHPDMDAAVFEDLWETIRTGKTWHGEIKNRAKDGEYYWVDSDISPLVDRNGEIYAYMAIRQDVTARKELEILSVTDRLTSLYNRQKLDTVLEEQSVRFRRYGENYTLIIFDIDHFKHVNDTFGHVEGDRVLRRIAAIVREQIRQTDIVGRWGGEEFLIVCPHTDLHGGLTRAEVIRRSIGEHDFGLPRQITASFGVVEIAQLPGATGGDVTLEALRGADEALYAAKQGGRNRVVPYRP
ncbi:MAG: diguanylate cyclase [Alkalispirochaeta sp.]